MRFTAGDPNGTRSGIWRLWTNPKGDVYLASRMLAQKIKVSLHVGGKFRVAFVDQHPAGPDIDRAILKWERSDNLAPGLSRALAIAVAPADVTIPTSPQIRELDINWQLPPSPDHIGNFTLLLSADERGKPLEGTWPGQRGMDSELVYQEELGNGDTLWVVWHTEPITADHLESRKKLGERLASPTTRKAALLALRPDQDPSDPRLRAVGMGEENGCGILWDVPVTWPKDC